MPLTKQPIAIGLGKGLDTKSDPKQLQAGVLTLLENAVFTSPGKLRKRPGTETIGTSIFDGSNVTRGGSFLSLGDQTLIHDGKQLYAWDSSGEEWVPVSKHTGNDGWDSVGVPTLTVTKSTVTSYSWNLAHPDTAIHSSGYALTVWENPSSDSGGGLFWTLHDTVTDTRLFSDQPMPLVTTAAAQRSPKVLALGNYLIVLFINEQSLYYATIDTGDVSAGIGTPVVILTTLPAAVNARHFDAAIIDGKLMYVTVTQGAQTLAVIGGITTSLGLLTDLGGNLMTGTTRAVAIFEGRTAGSYVFVVSSGTGVTGGVYFKSYNANGTVDEGFALIESVYPVTVTGAATSTRIQFFYTVAPPNQVPTWNYRVRTRSKTAAAGWAFAGDATDLVRSVGLAGKAFVHDGDTYVPVLYDSPVQSTGFLVDASGRPMAKWLAGAAGGQLVGPASLTATSLLPEVNYSSADGGHVTMAAQETTNGGSNLIDAIALSFADRPLARAVLADTLHFGGGLLWMFDGASTVEHGFLLFPETVFCPNPGGNYQYQYSLVYEWTDNQGHLHRSAPSIPATQAQSAPIDASSRSVSLQLPTLRLTAKQTNSVDRAPHLRVKLVLYRTLNGGSVFYRCLDVSQEAPYNSVTVDSINVTDTTSDEQLLGHPPLYTTGGVIENFSPNPPLAAAQVKNRVWLLDSTDPFLLWFSKEVRPGLPVEFSDLFTMNLEARGGPATAIANMDEKVIVLRESTLSHIVGFGPAANDTAINFEEVPIPASTGCVDARSVVVGEPGVIYKSHKGFYVLDRALTTRYIGAAVEEFNQYACTSAVALPKTTWMLFTMSNGVALLYDYLMDQWATYTGVAGKDAGIWNDLYAYLDVSGAVHRETPGTYSDSGAYVPMRFKTGWLNLNGLSGFGRLWTLIVLGEWKSPHKLKVEFAVDYNDTIVQTAILDAPVLVKPYQWRIDCQRSSIQSVQITVTEMPYDASTGEGLDLSGLSMEIGVKPHLFKPSSDRSA